MGNKLLIAKREGWETVLPIKEENGMVTCRKSDLERFLKKISYTHDVTSGGFTFHYEDSEPKGIKGVIDAMYLPYPWLCRMAKELLELPVRVTRLWYDLYSVEAHSSSVMYVELVARKYGQQVKWW